MENNENLNLMPASPEDGEVIESKPVHENNIGPNELAQKIVRILDERKARNLKLLHVEKNTIIADYFVIASGTSNTAIRGMANELEFKLGEEDILPAHIEGLDEATWVVLDYSSVIVHIFNSETRSFYNLEKLWNEAEEVDIKPFIIKEDILETSEANN